MPLTGSASPDSILRLPRGFVFGTAGSATQLEGSRTAGRRAAGGQAVSGQAAGRRAASGQDTVGDEPDGRALSLWDTFATLPGRIADGSTTAVAVDHFHRWADDLALAAELGTQVHRMSLSWSRIQPGGTGPADPAGLAFYDRVIDRLLEWGITPFVALDHWDLPLQVMEHGGWLTRSTADAFGDYAALVSAALGDRVTHWITLVEPLVHMAYGYAIGIDAPGLTLLSGAFSATHHQLLAHGRALQVLRERPGAQVGIVNHHTTVEPAGPTAADRAAAAFYEMYHNRQFTDPVLLGSYPPALLAMPGAATDVIENGDLATISAPLDFYGVSFAHPTVVAAAPLNSSVPFSLEVRDGGPMSAAGWPVAPERLTQVLTDLDRRYPQLPPVYVTGIGGAFDDQPIDGTVEQPGDRRAGAAIRPDTDRIAYLEGTLAAIAAAIEQGCDVRGYFHWSLLDSWEWAEGFTRHFGLVRVDPVSLERTPRASFRHYRESISEHG